MNEKRAWGSLEMKLNIAAVSPFSSRESSPIPSPRANAADALEVLIRKHDHILELDPETISFEEIIHNGVTLGWFITFTSQRHAQEGLEFWQSSQPLLDTALEPEQAVALFSTVWETFLAPDSPLEVNVEGGIRAGLKTLLEEKDGERLKVRLKEEGFLESAHREVLRVTRTQSFVAFRQMLQRARTLRVLSGPVDVVEAPAARKRLSHRRSKSASMKPLSRESSPRSRESSPRLSALSRRSAKVGEERGSPRTLMSLSSGSIQMVNAREPCMCCNSLCALHSGFQCRSCRKWACVQCLSKGRCHLCHGQSSCPVRDSKK